MEIRATGSPEWREEFLESLDRSDAAHYVLYYLEQLGATSVIREPHYVDRHYHDTFLHYHARGFHPPKAHCERYHFFRSVRPDELTALIQSATGSEEKVREVELDIERQCLYLGYLVRRPLPGSRVGRTVLLTFEDHPKPEPDRRFPTSRPYKVHLLGLTLSVRGLAFQEQDPSSAVCASTALWVALQKVAHLAGHRTPTPSQITRSSDSPFAPSAGLDGLQMFEALAKLGYAPEEIGVSGNRSLFRAQIHAALSSGLPVVLLVRKAQPAVDGGNETQGHAVTLTGFRAPDVATDIRLHSEDANPLSAMGGGLRVVYAHDDNLGMHAHYELIDDEAILSPEGNPSLLLRRGRTSLWRGEVDLAACATGSPRYVQSDGTPSCNAVALLSGPTECGRIAIHVAPVTGAWQLGDVLVRARVLTPGGDIEDGSSVRVPSSTAVFSDKLRCGSSRPLEIALEITAVPQVTGRLRIELELFSSTMGWDVDDWIVDGALAAKPDGLRTSILGLVNHLTMWRVYESWIDPGETLSFEAKFMTGIAYRRTLAAAGLDAESVFAFQRKLVLPRFLGVLTARSVQAVGDMLVDVSSDTGREGPVLLGLAFPTVSLESREGQHLDVLATHFQVPLLIGSSSSNLAPRSK